MTEIIHACDHAPQWFQGIGMGLSGGAISRVKPDATAYWNRMSQWDLLMFGVWADHTQDEHNAQTMRELWKPLDPFTKGYYVNTEPAADEQRLRATYGDNYPKLAELKKKYDPDNLFRLNANIRRPANADLWRSAVVRCMRPAVSVGNTHGLTLLNAARRSSVCGLGGAHETSGIRDSGRFGLRRDSSAQLPDLCR